MYLHYGRQPVPFVCWLVITPITEQFPFFFHGYMLSFQIDPQPLEGMHLLTFLLHGWHTYSETPTSHHKIHGILSNTSILNSRIGANNIFTNSTTTEKPNELWVQAPYYFNTLFLRPVRNQHFTQKSHHFLLPNPTSSREGRSSSSTDPLPVTVSHLNRAWHTRLSALRHRHTHLPRFAFFSQSSDVPTGSSLPCDCINKKKSKRTIRKVTLLKLIHGIRFFSPQHNSLSRVVKSDIHKEIFRT